MKKRKTVAKIMATIMSLALVVSLVPSQTFAAKSVDGQVTSNVVLEENESIAYNTATIFNYSDSFYADSNRQTVNLIDGLGDYNEDTLKLAYELNPDSAKWEGLYFGSGKNAVPTYSIGSTAVNVANNFAIGTTSSGLGEIKDGTDGLWDADYTTKAWTTWTSGGNNSGYIQFDATTSQTVKQIKIHFLNTERSNTPDGTYSTYPTTISVHNGANNIAAVKTVTLDLTDAENAENYYTATITLDEAISTQALTLSFTYDTGYFVMLTEVEMFSTVDDGVNETKSIADYNVWSGHSPIGGAEKRAYVYTGLVEDTLVNGQIKFTVPEAGVFDTSNTSNKEVYQNVGIPFIYDSTTGYYTFDAGPDGYNAHFDDLNSDNVISNTDSNIEKASGKNLVLDTPFTANDNAYTSNANVQGFFPFNCYGGTATDAVYHFGMSMAVDFTMTENGTVDGSETGEAITFDFAGDDDVWVFIDGQLVLDLGGIHDSVSAKIDFKANEITMWSTNASYGSGVINKDGIGSTDAGYITSLGQILNEGTAVGAIAKSYETFADEGEHTLTIYYLERGRGFSNCKIKYNLPNQDALEVTKHIQLAAGETQAITEEEWSALNALDFTMRVLDEDGNPITGKYALYDSSSYVDTYQTDANGYFTLKNNQKARFVGTLGTDYTVEEVSTETALPSAVWKTASWSGNLTAATVTNFKTETDTNTNTDNSSADEYKYIVKDLAVRGDKVDTLSIQCTNYISRPFVSIAGETIVIDYGLPVKIDIMANDVQSSGKAFVINNLSTPTQGTVKVLNTAGNEVESTEYTQTAGYYYLEYTPTTYISDIEKITYTYKVLDDTLDGAASYSYPTGVATIVPATSMYYEENFLNAAGTNYIQFSAVKGFTGFTAIGTATKVYQEPGVVGTLNDSTYGTDTVYLTGTGDSNGTSYKADTTDGPAAFRYTFTGTGTAFFARTSATSGYLRIAMENSVGDSMFEDEEGNAVDYNYIDTKYNGVTTEGGYDVSLPLYNIPVFNIEDLPYDTYTVTVTVAKPSQWYTTQDEFYLDGVRVYDPIDMTNQDDENYAEVYAAYEKDLEADAQVTTLRSYMLDTQTVDPDAEELVWTESSMIMFTDTNGSVVKASEYKSNGPKQELYMTTGQSIRFVLANWFDDKPTGAKLYLGAKVPEGKTATISVNGIPYTISNTTDCYYDITSAVSTVSSSYNGLCVIEVDSGFVSLTNMKCTGFAEFSLAGMDVVVNGNENVYSLLRRTVVETDTTVDAGETEDATTGTNETDSTVSNEDETESTTTSTTDKNITQDTDKNMTDADGTEESTIDTNDTEGIVSDTQDTSDVESAVIDTDIVDVSKENVGFFERILAILKSIWNRILG